MSFSIRIRIGECLENGLKMTEDEIKEHGINQSKQHVDFMVGTNDLNIIGTTKDGREISIFENGCFSKNLLNN